MQPLRRTLEDHDLGHLRIVAELWEIDLPAGPARQAAAALSEAMLATEAAEEAVAALPPPAAEALAYLLERGGRAPLADLTRAFGPLTRVGPGRRDREKPWRDPHAALDALYFRGLLALAFTDTASGPQEFGFVPHDLLERLPRPRAIPGRGALGRGAPNPDQVRRASASAVDDATTLLAALRRRPSRTEELPAARRSALSTFLRQPQSLELLLQLLLEQGVLRRPPLRPEPQATRQLLEQTPGGALRWMMAAWLESPAWNDLAHTPGLSAGGRAWPNDPLVTRTASLNLFQDVPVGEWWDLGTFLEAVRRERPGFQRPAGDFDSWYLHDEESGRPLTGFDHWAEVEGRFLQFLVEGPLAWLGALDLGLSGSSTIAFRRTSWSGALLGESRADDLMLATPGPSRATVEPNGVVRVPAAVPAALRYQIARATAWVAMGEDEYVYRVTPSSLAAAKAQSLTAQNVRAILEQASGEGMHAGLAAAMARWQQRSTQARMETTVLLQTSDARVLRELQARRTTSRYLGDVVGLTAVRVRERDVEALAAAAARLGLLLDLPTPGAEWP